MKQKVQVRITGKKGKTDGYAETIIGLFMYTGLLQSDPKFSKKDLDNGLVQIYLEMQLTEPPLGNLGEKDLSEYAGDNP